MSEQNFNPNKTTKLQRLLKGRIDQTIKTRLPRRGKPATHQIASSSPAHDPDSRRSRLLRAFWTFTGALSLVVNIVLLAVTLIALRMLGAIQVAADAQFSGLLGGLYSNFVKMDEANIRSNIRVEKDIPVQFTLNVSGPTNVVLTQSVTINNALVTVQTGGLNIVNAQATIVLPQGTSLPVNIQNLVVPVDQMIPVVLDVPVDIPLDQTELHEPFVGLQDVVRPFYCLVRPGAVLNDVQVCSPIQPTPITTEPITP